VSCAEGDTGNVYEGELPFEVTTREIGEMPQIPLKIAMNVGNPRSRSVSRSCRTRASGSRASNSSSTTRSACIPRRASNTRRCRRPEGRRRARARGYADPKTFFREKLVEGIATIAAAFWPKPVIVRLSDFKSNEYRKLLGGERYEPDEENPMLGFRGASRFLAAIFRACFELECAALRKVREELGLTNVEVMVPFVRTVGEAQDVVRLLAENGLGAASAGCG
jgi:pyruvate,water dikinase